MKKYGLGIFILIVSAIFGIASAQAGGLWLYEEATPDMGVGGAGRQGDGKGDKSGISSHDLNHKNPFHGGRGIADIIDGV